MIQLYMFFLGALSAARLRLREQARDDRGSVSIEQVVISAALLGGAVALTAVIVAAVTGRMGAIT